MKFRTPNEIDMYVGRRVRLLRTAAGMSQQCLGQAIGVTYQQIQKYEKGHNRVSAGKMHMIAQTLGVGPSYFLEGSPQITPPLRNISNDNPIVDTAVVLECPEWSAVQKEFSTIQSKQMQKRVAEVVLNFIQIYKMAYSEY